MKDLVKKFRLKVKANDRTKIVLLKKKSKIKVIGLISNKLIAIQYLYILGSLYVIIKIELIVIFETDWINRYQADIWRSNNVIKVWINNNKARINFQY